MINVKVFCPLERVAVLMNNINSFGAKFLNISVDGIGSFFGFALDKKDHSLGLSIERRAALLQCDEFKGTVDFIGENNRLLKSCSYVVKNVLKTDAMPVVGGSTNGVVGDQNVSFTEALTTINGVKASRQGSGKNQLILRPCYQYIINKFGGDMIEIYGPAHYEFEVSTMVLDTPAGQINLYTGEKEVIATESPEEPVNDVTPVKPGAYKYVLRDESGKVTPLLYGQRSYDAFGVKVHASEFLKILQFAAFCDISDSLGKLLYTEVDDRVVYIDVVHRGGKLFMSDALTAFFNETVVNSAFVENLFSRFTVVNDVICALDNTGNIGKLVGDHSSACFTMSLAYLFALQADGSVYTYLNTILQMLDNGLVFINGDHVIEGKTSALIEKPKSFVLSGGVAIISATLQRVATMPQDGYFILGFDHITGVNLVPGEPDHYCVCAMVNGRPVCVFDPMQNDVFYKRDMSAFLQLPDTRVVAFDGSVEVSYIEREEPTKEEVV